MSESINIIHAETHNLKGIDVTIPKNKLVVITGVSGSGKSSLAFDTLYAEWQKRYLESLSTYARMIVSDISDDIKVQEITGLSPTIAIHQKTVSNNPRSIVGTITEIYNYYRLLYSSIGVMYCPNHPHIALSKQTIQDVVDYLSGCAEGSKFHISIPLSYESPTIVGESLLSVVSELGFVRIETPEEVLPIGDINLEKSYETKDIYIIVDRLIVKSDDSYLQRLRDSIALAYEKGKWVLRIRLLETDVVESFHRRATCPLCDFEAEEKNISHFSFNSHYGACQSCHGLGVINSFSEESIINPRLSLAEGAILPWTQHPYYTVILEALCKKYKIPFDTPYAKLTAEAKQKILHGVEDTFEISHVSKFDTGSTHRARYEGVIPNLERRFTENDGTNAMTESTFQKRIAPFVSEIVCPECHGHRLNRESLSVQVGGKNIGELCNLSVESSRVFFRDLKLTKEEQKISVLIFKNIVERLEFLEGVGLSYVTLSRRANTLSGGESQRIRLATQIGTRLEGIIYVLDEPSIGLHPRDNGMLIENLKRLAAIGNTVVVVEHDEDIMRECDYIIDIGPHAWVHGGEVIFSGTYAEILKDPTSETGKYLSWAKQVTRANRVKPGKTHIAITGARENNLKNISVEIPTACITAVTGVSGSGKSSLIMDILANYALNYFNDSNHQTGKFETITGLESLDKGIIIDQSPIGKTPHSNIATYTGVFTYIREVFAASLEAQKRGYGPGRFSFNTRWGRCEVCEGSGTKKIEMHFLPDVYVQCDACQGTRYNRETLRVQFKGKNIAEVLDMTIDEAATFFTAFPRIKRVLEVLVDVWLGYIRLGQSAPTLSGWEAQRIKLAFDLAKRSTGKTLYILDEPTTGLHFSDVQKLLDILDRLVQKGNTVVVIEHHLDIIANADYIIDIGVEGGDKWGNLVFSGTPSDMLTFEGSHTAEALRKHMKHRVTKESK